MILHPGGRFYFREPQSSLAESLRDGRILVLLKRCVQRSVSAVEQELSPSSAPDEMTYSFSKKIDDALFFLFNNIKTIKNALVCSKLRVDELSWSC